MNEKIVIAKPSITDLEIDYVEDAIRNGWGDKCYDYIHKLEKAFANYVGVKYSLATSSCTGAIHMALAAINIKAGDEVIVPEITWIATAAPITYLGAKPVFVDVLADTWCIDPAKIEAAITLKTKAIIAVQVYGNLAEMDEIKRIASKHNLFLIEDAAEALGSEYKDRRTGSLGDVGVFSFHGTKTITTGEGGMLVTDNQTLFAKIKSLAEHGRVPEEEKLFFPHQVGYKYKISNLQAALGYAQISRIEELVERKRLIFEWYMAELKDIKANFNYEQQYAKNSYWMPTILIENMTEEQRNSLIKSLKNKGIDTRPFFYPLSLLPMFIDKPENEVAYSIYNKGLNLPSFFEMTKTQVKKVSEAILTEIKSTNDA